MSSNTICPLPKESDIPSEKVRKTSGYLDDTKQALVTNTYNFSKKGILKWLKKGKSKPNIEEEAITPPISAENKSYTVNKI